MADEHEIKFARALEIMRELERDARRQLGGRDFALSGAWSCKREALEGLLRRACFVTTLSGRALDEALREFLTQYARGLPHVVEASAPQRQKHTRRSEFIEQSPDDETPSLPGCQPARTAYAYSQGHDYESPHATVAERLEALRDAVDGDG